MPANRGKTTNMSNIRNTEHYFGGCPHCGDTQGYLNVRGNHWFVCDAHRTKWCVGYNLFSDWKDEDPEVWTANTSRLMSYSEVEPLPMESQPSEVEQALGLKAGQLARQGLDIDLADICRHSKRVAST
jgi:hypothetical protein